MDKVLKLFESIIPFLQPYDSWVKWMVSIWVFFTASMVISLLFATRSSQEIEIKKWTMTGDHTIDSVLLKLKALDSKSDYSEHELIAALNPLFTRPAFYGTREENWDYFLFALCKTRLILEQYSKNFKSKQVRDDIGESIQLMVQLQNDCAKLYGPTFSITKHISDHIQDSKEFINKLPNKTIEPDYEFYDARDLTIRSIREKLTSIGLIN